MTHIDLHAADGPLCPLPLELSWGGAGRPLPQRPVRLPPRSRRAAGAAVPSWMDTGPTARPFDFTGHVRRLCADIAARCPELNHVDASRLLVGATQARSGRSHGLQARVTPLRFTAGSLVRQRRGVAYRVQRYFVDGREMLYLVTFCLPRFLDRDFEDKFVTLFHELYHISPDFDGDLRHHGGRCDLHSHSKRAYDAEMGRLARRYLSGGADGRLHHFLRLDFAQLERRHGGVVAVVVPRPKLIPVAVGGRPLRQASPAS